MPRLAFILFFVSLRAIAQLDPLAFSAISDSRAYVPTEGLVAEWMMHGPEDSVGGTNTLTLRGDTLPFFNGGKLSGLYGTNGAYADVPYGHGADGATNLAYSLWAKAADTSANWLIFQRFDPGIDLQYRPDLETNMINFTFFRGASYYQKRFNMALQDPREWNHIIAYWGGGSDLRLYVNGEQKNASATNASGSPSYTNTSGQLLVGYVANAAGRYYRGELAEVRVYRNPNTNDFYSIFKEGPPQ